MIKIENLYAGYENNIILNNLNLNVNKGEMVAIVGPNGSGKSTLLKVLSGNMKLASGKIFINDIEVNKYKIKSLAQVMSFLPQVLKQIPQFTVQELVAFGRFPYTEWNKSLTMEDTKKIKDAIKIFDLENFENRLLAKLSGGERQRARIAMTFAQNTDILLLDEPNTFLDISHQYKILETLANYNRRKEKTILMVLHDLNQAKRFSDRIVVLEKGKIYADGNPDEVLNESVLEKVFNVNVKISEMEGEYKSIIPVSAVKN